MSDSIYHSAQLQFMNQKTLDSVESLVNAWNNHKDLRNLFDMKTIPNSDHQFLNQIMKHSDAMLLTSIYTFLGRMNVQKIIPGSEWDPDNNNWPEKEETPPAEQAQEKPIQDAKISDSFKVVKHEDGSEWLEGVNTSDLPIQVMVSRPIEKAWNMETGKTTTTPIGPWKVDKKI